MTRKVLSAGIGFLLLVIIIPYSSMAASLLQWNEVSGVDGYRLYYGNTQGSYSNQIEVGNSTQYELSNISSLLEKQTYYFVLRAYNSAGESENSNEIVYTVPDMTPPVAPSGIDCPEGTSNVSWQANSESDVQSYRVYFGTATRNYGPFIPVQDSTNYTVENLEPGTTYYFAVTAVDSAGNESPYSNEVVSTLTFSQDNVSPSVTITSPTSGSNISTVESVVSLSGTATDNVGIKNVTWSNSTGGSGVAVGTTNWSISNINLGAGENVITVQATDAAGNQGGRILTVYYDAPDHTAPLISFISPTDGSPYDTNKSVVDLAGTAIDDIGTTDIKWWNSLTGASGTASGTENWSINSIILAEGSNSILVIAEDAAGNKSSKKITVTYSLSDTTPPAISITSPSGSGQYQTSVGTIDLAGTASDENGVTEVTWSNNQGGSDIASGTTAWSASSVSLAEGDNTITVTAVDDAGNTGNATIVVTYLSPDTRNPVVSITSPTSNATYNTDNGVISLSGTVSDDRGVGLVQWTNSSGGGGTASGTSKWDINGIALKSGENLITVTATDTSGNTGSQSLAVTYTAPDTTSPSISVSSPVASGLFETTSGTVLVSGNASDNVGVTSVTWSNSAGGSGTAQGTSGWSISNISLSKGDNVITVTASDAAGNQKSTSITVRYVAPDTTPPEIQFSSPTTRGRFYFTRSSTMDITGTASDNDAVKEIRWENNKGGSGVAQGTANWTISNVQLQNGWNIISVTAFDAAGNSETITLYVVAWL